MRFCRLLVAVFVVSGVTGLAPAQEPPGRPPRPAIQVSAEATVSAKPDQAQVDIGVTTQAQTAEDAAAEDAKRSDAVIGALRQALGRDADIKTVGYSLNPDYHYPREGGRPVIRGYSANNIVQVKTGRLTDVGKILDSAIKAGANNIHRLAFTLKNEEAVRADALKEAVRKARVQADALAQAAGVRITRVLLIQASDAGGPRPMMDAAVAMRAAAPGVPPTPVEPGTIDVRAVVTLTVEISQ